MSRSQVTVRVRRDPEFVFACIERHAERNEPAWEPEVLGVEPLGPGPVREGFRARMTRRDFGSVRTTTYEVTHFDAPRELAVRHVDGPLDFALAFRVAAAGPGESEVTVTVDAVPRGALRVMRPVFALTAGGRNRRISAQMVGAIEAATPTPAAAAGVTAGPA